MKDLIERLKNNKVAFGLMTPEEQECFEKVGKENCLYYSITGWKTAEGTAFISMSTYAIKPDYSPDPEFVDLEIKRCKEFLGCEASNNLGVMKDGDFVVLSNLPSLPDFEGFWVGTKKDVQVDYEWVARHSPGVVARFGRPQNG